ncbi:DoxX family protein [Rufibacter latericius]|uniref:DoxX family protein n=1 Tax=Rufibacter latericius TaxID=2487040 RepID=A0A3M9MUX8_9BACT|nr:DoxX family protein [Rufibacter latericius]RNI29299.1 DoxX family protein [Rufibacter latericius]
MEDHLAPHSFLDRYKPYSAVLLRLAFGFHLIYFTQDNVFSYARMLEFRDFLEVRHVPFPFVGAIVSVAVQFLCGIFLIVGWQVRMVGFFILVNFILAFIIAHRGQSYEQFFQPVQLIAVGVCFLLHGAGALSLDHFLHQRRTEPETAIPKRQATF